MTEADILQILARGEDSHHQFKRDQLGGEAIGVGGVALELVVAVFAAGQNLEYVGFGHGVRSCQPRSGLSSRSIFGPENFKNWHHFNCLDSVEPIHVALSFLQDFADSTKTLTIHRLERTNPTVPIMPKVTEPKRKKPSQKAVLRSVASSTALETGQCIAELERRLQQPARFPHIKLARDKG